MIKKLENCFFKKHVITTWFDKKWKNWHFLKKQFSSFLIISPVILDLQKRTIPQIKAKNISFWPYSIKLLAKINIFWNRKQWICLMIFWPRLYRCKEMQNLTFFEKSYFQVFNHISGHIWPTAENYTSK